jgi:hypothetical protein
MLFMIGKPANYVFASLWSFVESAPVIEDRVEEFNSALETCLDSFLVVRLEVVPCLRTVSQQLGGIGGAAAEFSVAA